MKIENRVSWADSKTLHYKFVKLGKQKRLLTNELLALLPEIYESGVFKKYAGTIEEYAGRFGGLSGSVVRKRLRLEKYVYDKPELRDAIRTEGVHKVALLASLATRENDWMLADKVKNMSKPALQELSKELRNARGVVGVGGNGGNQSLFDCAVKSVSCKAIPTKITIELDEEMSFQFMKLKRKLGKNLSNKEALKIMMEELEGKIVDKVMREKVQIVESCELTDQKSIPGDTFKGGVREEKLQKSAESRFKTTSKRSYIKIALRREKLAETGGKCSYPGCNRPAENFHHVEPVSEGGRHDLIRSLCKIHHEFMHNGLVENQVLEAANWQLGLAGKLGFADHFYRYYRKS